MVQKYSSRQRPDATGRRSYLLRVSDKLVPLCETQRTYMHTHFALSAVAAARACISEAYLPIAAAPAAI